MILSELKGNYVTELYNNPNIKSEETIKQYWAACNKFISENNRVYRMSSKEIKHYMASIREEYSDSYYNVIGSSVKILYSVLGQPQKMKWFKAIKTKRKYQDIVSVEEFIVMMRRTQNLKHKTIIILFYSTGIRLTELLNIKLTDIDWINNRIFIRTLKNGKNRHVPMHPLTRRYMSKYIRKHTPFAYLFNGQGKLQYSPTSIQKVFKNASNGAYTPHSMRHAFITNMIEKVDVFMTKELSGHECLESTLHYNHVPAKRLNTIYNPLDAAL